MATGLEKESIHARKARLIKQNEMYRQALQAEAENLRGTSEWIEKGYVFLSAVGGIRKLAAPHSQRRGKERNSFANILRVCAVGVRIWRNLGKV